MGAIGRFVRQHGGRLLLVCLLVTVALSFAASKLAIETDLTNLFPDDDPYFIDYKYFVENFGVSDMLVLVAREETDGLAEKLTTLTDRLRQTGHFTWVELRSFPGREKKTVILSFPKRPCTDQAFCQIMLTDVRRHIDETQAPVEWTGAAAVATEANEAIHRDARRTGLVAFAMIFVILAVILGDALIPIIAMAPLLMGLIWTLGIAQLLYGRVNVLSAALPTALLGIGIDYAVHLDTVRDEFLDRPCLPAWEGVFGRVGQPLVIGMLTTTAAFLALSFARLSGFVQMGRVGAIALITVFLATIVTIPVLLDWRRRLGLRFRALSLSWLQALAHNAVRHRGICFAVFGLVTAPLLVIAAGMEFETDPRAYQDESLPSLKLYEHLAAQMKLTVQPVFLAVPDIRAERRVLQKVRAFVGKDRPFNQIDSLATRFERLSAQPQLERFIGRDGRLYIMLFPSVNPYEAEALKSLVQAVDHVLEACGPDITAYSGGPVLYHHMMELNRQDLKRTGLAAVIIVIVVLGLLVRRPRHFVCALVPLVGGMIWMVAIIRLAGYKFNLANTVAMPLVVGLGIDYGVHVVHRLRTGSVEAAVATTGRAILASALTTAIAFLSLCFAGNSSLVGMGLAAGVGILSCLVWSLVFLPALAGKRRSSEISSP